MFKPLNMLRNLKIRMKLSAVLLLMAIPITTLLYLFVVSSQRAVVFAQKEILGVEYLVSVKTVFERVAQHRGLSASHFGGNTSALRQITSMQPLIDAALQHLKSVDGRLGASLQTTEKLNAMVSAWQNLQRSWKGLGAPQSFAQHTQVLSDLHDLIQHAADRSNLILDPDLDSYYLMDTIVNRLPALAEDLETLRGLGTSVAILQVIELEQQFRMQTLIDRVETHLKALQRGLQVAFGEHKALGQQLAPSFAMARNGVENFLQTTSRDLVQAGVISIAATDYFHAGTKAMSEFLTFYDTTAKQLREVLQARVAKEQMHRNVQLAMALLLVALAVVLAVYMNRLITSQVGAFATVFNRISLGDFGARAEVLSEDELGASAVALNGMLDNTLSLIQSQAERDAMQNSVMKLLEEISGVAEGDLTAEAEVTEDVTGAIADSFNNMIQQLRNIVANVQQATIQVSTSANEIQTTAEHLAAGSTMQAEQITESSAALDEMAVSIQQVSENAALSANVAEQALANAKQGTTAVHNTIQGMQRIRTQVQETAKRIKRLGERSQEIGEIVQLIGDIADRTSILALNASIQAARAGEAGRAFAVVAEEVERLADRSSNATKQIAGLVNAIQSETNEAVTAMEESTREVVQGSQLADQAGQALGEIEGVSARLSELIHSISQASTQQARGSENLSKAMGEIAEVTQQTAAGTKQAAVSISHLANLADDLRGSVSTFRLPGDANGPSRAA
jgi:twitching motility protein PilJ